MSIPDSTSNPIKRTTRVYSDYQNKQMRDVLVPLLLACPARIAPYINHDVRQLFCDAGEPLFGDKRAGWLIEDYSQFITDIKRRAYKPVDLTFARSNLRRVAILWHTEPKQVTSAFEVEFHRWLAYNDRAHDYGLGQGE